MPRRAPLNWFPFLNVVILATQSWAGATSAQDRSASRARGADESKGQPIRPDYDALDAIVLPARWTPEEVDRYINDILDVSSRTFHVFENDPQARMLSEVGPGNIESLFRAFGRKEGAADAHLERAILLVIQDTHQDLLFEYLPHHPRLASIVIAKHWVRDARDILLEGLERRQYLGPSWLRAIVELNDPRAPEALRRHMVGGVEPNIAYGALKAAGYRDLDGAVFEAWRAMSIDRGFFLDSFASIAARHGVIEALEHIARAVESRREEIFSRDMERALVELVPYEGNPQELAEFVIENAARLSFDARSKRYLVR